MRKRCNICDSKRGLWVCKLIDSWFLGIFEHKYTIYLCEKCYSHIKWVAEMRDKDIEPMKMILKVI